MLSLLLIIKNILKYLNSNETIENLAYCLTLALAFAFIPFNGLFHPILFLCLIIFNGNLLVFLFVTPILKLIAPVSLILFHNLGDQILTFSSLQGVFEFISNIPILIFSNWNNTITMGGYITFIIFGFPIYLIFKTIIKSYRTKVLPTMKKFKIFKLIKVPNWMISGDK